MDRRRQMMLDEIGQQAHEISAAAFLSHVVRGSVRAGCSRIAAPAKTPRILEVSCAHALNSRTMFEPVIALGF
jgi:hypothetical protein